MKFRNCTKSGKANTEIFSELAWNNFRSDNIFRIRVVVSDLNSEFRIFFPGHSDNSEKNFEFNSEYSDNSKCFSEYSDNSECFSELIRSIRTIPNFFPSSFGVFGQFRTDFRIICGKNMEIHQNPVFSRKYFFPSEKSDYSELIFGISCYG